MRPINRRLLRLMLLTPLVLLLMLPLAILDSARAHADTAAAVDGGAAAPAPAPAPALQLDAGPAATVEPVTATPAPAAPSSPPVDPDAGALRELLNEVLHGGLGPKTLAALLLIGVVYINRKYAGLKWIPWGVGTWLSTTDRGGVVSTFSLSFAGSLGHQIAAGAWPPTVTVFWTAFVVAVLAIGGYTGVRRFFFPADQAALPKATALA